MFDRLQRLNSRIDQSLAPENPDRLEMYKRILSEIEFDRALHLGSGRDKLEVSDELADRGEVIALDPDVDGLEANPLGTKMLAEGQRLPFKNRSFDLVFSEFVFEHLPDPHSALREINRVLRPGGSFVVVVPNPDHYYARISGLTPFWFHKLWFRLMGEEDYEQDKFPTQYEWGTYSDVTEVDLDWSIEEFHSFPGPTVYTRILPVHILFVLLDRAMIDRPEHHVSYLVHYEA